MRRVKPLVAVVCDRCGAVYEPHVTHCYRCAEGDITAEQAAAHIDRLAALIRANADTTETRHD